MRGRAVLLREAGCFHGHVGPFLAIGLRMGLAANRAIGFDPLETRARVWVEPVPPKSCLVDGIQFATGCTLGKSNIKITPSRTRIAARFVRSTGSKGRGGARSRGRGPHAIAIRLRPEFLRRMERDLAGKGEKAVIDYAGKIMDTPAGELFEVTR